MRIMSYAGAVKILFALRYPSVIGPRVAVRWLSSGVEKQEPLWANMNVEEFGTSRQNLQGKQHVILKVLCIGLVKSLIV